jgi:hypothetical protein
MNEIKYSGLITCIFVFAICFLCYPIGFIVQLILAVNIWFILVGHKNIQ